MVTTFSGLSSSQGYPAAFTWKRPWLFGDAARARAESDAFAPSRAAEKAYGRKLNGVAGQIAEILRKNTPEDAAQKLREYAEVLEPWARQSAANMVLGVRRKNDQAWRGLANRMGLDVKALMASPGIGEAVQKSINANVGLIKSLSIDAADAVEKIIAENMSAGSRADDLARRIESVSGVSAARASTIARTEVSKAGVALTMARADSVGSTGYIWRTARDGDTREGDRAMEGQFIPWDKPPTIDGMTAHAGEKPNCRCYPEPVIPNGAGGVHNAPLPTQVEEIESGEKRLYSHWERREGSHVIPHAPGNPLVNVGRAVFVSKKLTHYSLDPEHTAGGHKAVSFRKMLGIEKEHAGLVEKQIMAWLEHLPANPDKTDIRGQRFKTYAPITGPNGRTVDVMTAWIYEKREGNKISMVPRLINCFIDRKIDEQGRYNGPPY